MSHVLVHSYQYSKEDQNNFHFFLENSEHCEECGICVENWEGHYSWLGKCIGKGNYNFFVFFNLSLLIWTV